MPSQWQDALTSIDNFAVTRGFGTARATVWHPQGGPRRRPASLGVHGESQGYIMQPFVQPGPALHGLVQVFWQPGMPQG